MVNVDFFRDEIKLKSAQIKKVGRIKERIMKEYNLEIKNLRNEKKELEDRLFKMAKLTKEEFIELITEMGFVVDPFESGDDVTYETHICYQRHKNRRNGLSLWYQGYTKNGEYIVNNIRVSHFKIPSQIFINPSRMTDEEFKNRMNEIIEMVGEKKNMRKIINRDDRRHPFSVAGRFSQRMIRTKNKSEELERAIEAILERLSIEELGD